MREDIVNLFKGNNSGLKSDEFWALKGINLTVQRGECVGLYGPNGAGKSTILKLIASVTYPTKGNLKVRGRVAPLIELGAGFHMDLTGRENIFINGAILGMSIKEIRSKLNEIIEFSELGQFINMPVKKYSSGMYLRLGFSIAVHSFADILLIDEILAVGDEDFQKKCKYRLEEFKKEGKTLLIVSHDRSLMESFTDRIIFLNRGEMVQQL
ncbi:MAG: ABC transporter ATP-binding protein [Thermodesulfovibrionales bacterium]